MELDSRFVYFCKNGIEMGIIQREILSEARLLLTQFRALCIVGPRQSGKTTLSRLLFKQKPYVSLENPSVQAEAESNPETFLHQFPNGAVLDEVQRFRISFVICKEYSTKAKHADNLF